MQALVPYKATESLMCRQPNNLKFKLCNTWNYTDIQKPGNNGTADGFWKIQRVKLPDLSEVDTDVMDEAGCHALCLKNCSCKAYSYVSGIGCLVWGVHLVDMHIFTGGGGNDMYLRLAGIELGK